MQVNVMGDATASEMEPFFRDCFDNVTKMVTWIARKQKSFGRFQVIVQQLIKERKIQYGDVILKSVETRFVSGHARTERVMLYKKVYKVLVKDEQFLEWLHSQSKPIRKEVHTPVFTTSFFCVLDDMSYFCICRYQFLVMCQTYQ